MDGQALPDKLLRHDQITSDIIGCAFEVINELGIGFLESVYEKALLIALRQRGHLAISQHPMTVMFRSEEVGTFFADILVDEKVIVELKAAKAITPEHQAQVINYLQATGIDVGLLINFGNPKLEYKRFTRTKKSNMDTQDSQDKTLS